MLPYQVLSERECKYILNSFNDCKRIILMNNNYGMCPYLHDKDFFIQHNSVICGMDETMDKYFGVISSLCKNIKKLARNEPLPYMKLKVQFLNRIRNMTYTEVLLFCALLLLDFHNSDDCSQYLTLALKLKLLAYWHSGYIRKELPENVMKTMVGCLKYISFIGSKYLFMECLNMFLVNCSLSEDNLSVVFEEAKIIGFSIFRFCDVNFCLTRTKYIQRSLFQNLKRFLILAEFGHEDQYYEGALHDYYMNTIMIDKNKLFGYTSEVTLQRMIKAQYQYRSLQVVYLYNRALYDVENDNAAQYDKVLLVLWATIPDPFLTREEFLDSFEQPYDFPGYSYAWRWYERVVLKHVAEPKDSPRSLKHLARCSVRRRLAESVPMPFGIESLCLPATLKSYLRLDDSFSLNPQIQD